MRSQPNCHITAFYRLHMTLFAFFVMLVGAGVDASATHAQNAPIAVLRLRTADGTPIVAAKAAIISWGWGVPKGQLVTTIAEGMTDGTGKVAFIVGGWPRAPYYVQFSPTPSTTPLNLPFVTHNYPPRYDLPQTMLGGQTDGVQYVLAADGLVYTDVSTGDAPPRFDPAAAQADAIQNVTPRSGSAFLATAVIGTQRAEASGAPSPTPPPHKLIPPLPLPTLYAIAVPPDSQLTAAATTPTVGADIASSSTRATLTESRPLIVSIVGAFGVLVLVGVVWTYPRWSKGFWQAIQQRMTAVIAKRRHRQHPDAAAWSPIVPPRPTTDDSLSNVFDEEESQW